MLTISREPGAVTSGGFTQEQSDALWRVIVKNMAAKALAQMEEQKKEATADV